MDAELFHKLPPADQRELLEGPAIQPPPGIEPNFQNPPNQRELGWAIVPLCSAIIAIAMALRLYSRVFVLKTFMIEDCVAMAALGAYIILHYFIISFVVYPGAFVHTWDIRLKDLASFLYKAVSAIVVHGIVVMLLKTAIVLDLLRIFSPHGQRGWFFWTSHLIIWVNIIFYTTCIIVEIIGCQARHNFGHKLIPESKCTIYLVLNLASSAVNLFSDLLILVLPQPAIWKLHISTRKRVGISAIYAVALFACISAAMRLDISISILHDPDIVYVIAPFGLWLETETVAGFLILGVPAIPKIVKSSPLLQKLVTFITSRTTSSANKTKTNSRKGLPSWYKPASRRRAARGPGWSTLSVAEEGSVLRSLDNVGRVKTTDTVGSYMETVSEGPRVHGKA